MLSACYFADSVMFNIAVTIGFQPGGGMIKLCLPDAGAGFLATFGEDRAAMRRGGTLRCGSLAECKANMRGLLPMIEAQLQHPYLFGAQPCVADFALYHVLWPVWKVADTRALLAPFPRTEAFVARMAAIGNGASTEISVERALEVAKGAKPEPIARPEAIETDGIALGEQVNVMPVDYALDPVKGELVTCSATEIAVRRTDPRAGTVVAHLPRFGSQLARA